MVVCFDVESKVTGEGEGEEVGEGEEEGYTNIEVNRGY